MMTNVLIVKHLPKKLSMKQREEFLIHFGAKSVRCMPDKGRLKYTAFALFEDHNAAATTLRQIHQLEFFGQILSVEFSKSNFEKYHPSITNDPPAKVVKEVGQEKKLQDNKTTFPGEIHGISQKINVDFPLNPRYEYMYPMPTVSILTNIANALASVPKFYVQVLHLMNKMNLPAPFGNVTPTPSIPFYQPSEVSQSVALAEDNVLVEGMDISSSEESELESDSEAIPTEVDLKSLKHPPTKKRKIVNPVKFSKTQTAPQSKSNHTTKPEDVFENTGDQNIKKKLELKLPSEIGKIFESQQSNTLVATNDRRNINIEHESGHEIDQNSGSIDVCETGFGKKEPVVPVPCDEEEEEDMSDTDKLLDYISSRELRKNRLSSHEQKSVSVFKNYDPGERSTRLYVKNIHKRVEEKELKWIFGRYVKWTDETQRIMFDIRLMKEGRMKGQAFVTLPSEKYAEKALKETNGYLLEGKPIVVTFARSAKSKTSS